LRETLCIHSLALRQDQYDLSQARKICGRKFMKPADYLGWPPRWPSNTPNHNRSVKAPRFLPQSCPLVGLARYVRDNTSSPLRATVARIQIWGARMNSLKLCYDRRSVLSWHRPAGHTGLQLSWSRVRSVESELGRLLGILKVENAFMYDKEIWQRHWLDWKIGLWT
jgi:hypothetical protein